MSEWNSCLVSWFVTSKVCGTVFQRSLKLVFSYDSQQSVTENAAYSHTFLVSAIPCPSKTLHIFPTATDITKLISSYSTSENTPGSS